MRTPRGPAQWADLQGTLCVSVQYLYNSRSAGYRGGRVNIQVVSFSGYTGESIFQVRHGKYRKSLLLADSGIRTHDPKTHGLSTTPFVNELEGISPFDHLQKVTHLLIQTKPYNKELPIAVPLLGKLTAWSQLEHGCGHSAESQSWHSH